MITVFCVYTNDYMAWISLYGCATFISKVVSCHVLHINGFGKLYSENV